MSAPRRGATFGCWYHNDHMLHPARVRIFLCTLPWVDAAVRRSPRATKRGVPPGRQMYKFHCHPGGVNRFVAPGESLVRGVHPASRTIKCPHPGGVRPSVADTTTIICCTPPGCGFFFVRYPGWTPPCGTHPGLQNVASLQDAKCEYSQIPLLGITLPLIPRKCVFSE